MTLVRPARHHPPSSPETVPENPGEVAVHHPAPQTRFRAALVTFTAYDPTPDGKWGVNYELVLEACCIKANNEDGYLSTTPGPDGRVPNDTKVLEAGRYYYVVPDDALYPVVPTFDAWRFPFTIPARWRNAFTGSSSKRETNVDYSSLCSPLAMATQVTMRDRACILTGYNTGKVFFCGYSCSLLTYNQLNDPKGLSLVISSHRRTSTGTSYTACGSTPATASGRYRSSPTK